VKFRAAGPAWCEQVVSGKNKSPALGPHRDADGGTGNGQSDTDENGIGRANP
jgi:hypothetical protein